MNDEGALDNNQYFLYEQLENGKIRVHLENLTKDEVNKNLRNLGNASNAPKLSFLPMNKLAELKENGNVEY